jgi:hypothetical protein
MAKPSKPAARGDGRFQPGRSGNPKGRPRKASTMAEAVAKAMDETVEVTSNGKRRRFTKRQAAATQLANKSAAGDLRASKLAADLAAKAERQAEALAPPQTLSATDQAIFARLAARLGLILKFQEQKDDPDYSI